MRPKFSVCSDYLGPKQKHWMLGAKRGTRSSIGPKISLAVIVVVAGVIGISGIDPQVIEAGWMQDSPTRLPKMSLSTPTTKRSGIVAAIPLPPPRALTTGEAMAFSSHPAVESLAETSPPLAAAEIPDAQAKANARPPEPAPAGAAKLANKSMAVLVVKKAAVVQKRAVQVEHRQRSHSGGLCPEWRVGLAERGWTGYSSFGNSRSF
jgi:hypothetical protein